MARCREHGDEGVDDHRGARQRKGDGPWRIDAIADRLGELCRAILGSTDAQVYVLLYPPMIPTRSSDTTADCSVENLAGVGSIGLSVDTSHRMVDLGIRLNQRIRERVASLADPRVHVVDVEAEFGGYQGHTISCGFSDRPTPWMNALRFDVGQVVSPSAGALRVEAEEFYTTGSFHPVKAGQEAMARALRREIDAAG
ncbi:hypothetical protein [Actinomycetospora sp. TBRC 11914]|uniref:hypothetical protein n=1 Tax=Actinomycetospora sp. TBRC 11914 TaxID=2729387 RepID=UPI00145C8407|nr:hypothetical protein [Actinomycetospora sp. TBRC 11914]NMO90322.1 hypothetical protein [Actinomycetospora sp. TBRC 11914]